MKPTKLVTAGITCAAGALVAVTALSTSAYAIPPEARSVTFTCNDPSGAIFGPSPFTATLSSSASSPTLPQKMKVSTSIGQNTAVPANSAAIVLRTIQTSSGGSGVGTVHDFAGSTHPAWGPWPMVIGPIPALARIPAGTNVRLKDTSAAPPSATNWSLRLTNPLAGPGWDIYCSGYQTFGSLDFGF
ncbi:hypothetical protein [Embleya sp. NPDC059259]|uniref:hypothetical protein n=1 Tax=unclassified Embleya TaxID=2699296 RepID=UPI0036C8B69C